MLDRDGLHVVAFQSPHPGLSSLLGLEHIVPRQSELDKVSHLTEMLARLLVRASRTSSHRRLAFVTRTHATAPASLTEGEQSILQKLSEKFSPTDVQVQDVSGLRNFTL